MPRSSTPEELAERKKVLQDLSAKYKDLLKSDDVKKFDILAKMVKDMVYKYRYKATDAKGVYEKYTGEFVDEDVVKEDYDRTMTFLDERRREFFRLKSKEKSINVASTADVDKYIKKIDAKKGLKKAVHTPPVFGRATATSTPESAAASGRVGSSKPQSFLPEPKRESPAMPASAKPDSRVPSARIPTVRVDSFVSSARPDSQVPSARIPTVRVDSFVPSARPDSRVPSARVDSFVPSAKPASVMPASPEPNTRVEPARYGTYDCFDDVWTDDEYEDYEEDDRTYEEDEPSAAQTQEDQEAEEEAAAAAPKKKDRFEVPVEYRALTFPVRVESEAVFEAFKKSSSLSCVDPYTNSTFFVKSMIDKETGNKTPVRVYKKYDSATNTWSRKQLQRWIEKQKNQ